MIATKSKNPSWNFIAEWASRFRIFIRMCDMRIAWQNATVGHCERVPAAVAKPRSKRRALRKTPNRSCVKPVTPNTSRNNRMLQGFEVEIPFAYFSRARMNVCTRIRTSAITITNRYAPPSRISPRTTTAIPRA